MKFLPVLFYLSIPYAYAKNHQIYNDLVDAGFDASGDVEKLAELGSDLVIGKFDPNDGLGVPLDATLKDLEIDIAKAQQIQQDFDVGAPSDPRSQNVKVNNDEGPQDPEHRELFPFSRWCFNFLGFGYANDAILTLTYSNGYSIRISCMERCCTRMWRCTSQYCYLQCRFSYILIYTGGHFCCNIRGRIVSPFSYGYCLNTLLCMT